MDRPHTQCSRNRKQTRDQFVAGWDGADVQLRLDRCAGAISESITHYVAAYSLTYSNS